MFKIFCLNCDWSITTESDNVLWFKYRYCPKCSGFTDAIKVDKKIETKFETKVKDN